MVRPDSRESHGSKRGRADLKDNNVKPVGAGADRSRQHLTEESQSHAWSNMKDKLRMSHSVLDFDDVDAEWKTIEVPLQENPIKSSKLKITGVVKVSLSWTPHTMMVQMEGGGFGADQLGVGSSQSRRNSFAGSDGSRGR